MKKTAIVLAAGTMLAMRLMSEHTNDPAATSAKTNYTIPQIIAQMQRADQTNNPAYRFALECLEETKQAQSLRAESERAVSNYLANLEDFTRRRAAIEREESQRATLTGEIMGRLEGATTPYLTNLAARLARMFGPINLSPQSAKSPKEVVEGLARAMDDYKTILDIARKVEDFQTSPISASTAISNLNMRNSFENVDREARARASRTIDAYLGRATLEQLTNLFATLRRDWAQPKAAK